MIIHIIEDDEFYAKSLRHGLKRNPEYEVDVFNSARKYWKTQKSKPDVVTLDYSIEGEQCEQTLQDIQGRWPDIPVIIISGQEKISTAIGLLRKGAYEYIEKSSDAHQRVWNVMKNLREKLDLKSEISSLRQQIQDKFEFSNLLKGSSPQLQKVFDLMKKAAKTNINVSVSGETGTGKELVARAIHFNSARKDKKLVTVNVTAIPNELLESELFGHEKGSFTGAYQKRIGKFEEANGGTLFLDEIADLDLNAQAKLLRAIQDMEITRIGSNKPIKLDVRIIAATHKNLAGEVESGSFREDLYYRLIGLPIELPPLRRRGNDILILARHFVHEFCRNNNLEIPEITPAANQKMMQYPYPGNVRELKAMVELAVVMCEGDQIDEGDISFSGRGQLDSLLTKERSLKEYERMIIHHFLEKYNDDVLLVASKLGIGKSTIYRLLKKEKDSHGEVV